MASTEGPTRRPYDQRVLARREALRPDRPDHIYLQFPVGLHACFSRFISRIQIPRKLLVSKS